MRIPFLTLTLVSLLNLPSGARDLAVGQPLPELTLPLASDGSLMATSDLRGQKTVFHIFAGW
jgi:hypothetical protein